MQKARKRELKSRPEIIWVKDDRVQHEFDGELYGGTVIEQLKNGQIRIEFDDGDLWDVPAEEVAAYNEYAFTGQKGFNRYGVAWSTAKGDSLDHSADNFDHTQAINFKFTGDDYDGIGVEFHGCWRKARFGEANNEKCWAIDIWARRNGQTYAIQSIPYFEKDPREDIRSLNADIGAAVSKWFYYHLNGNILSVDDWRKKAEHPMTRITRLETIDRLILKLREVRDTAIHAGGERQVDIRGDDESCPPMRIFINVTSQAIALKGKPPSLYDGAVFDNIEGRKSGHNHKTKGHSITLTPDDSNVEVLVAQLDAAKAAGDKSEARRIRGTLRKIGHKGGGRTFKTKAQGSK